MCPLPSDDPRGTCGESLRMNSRVTRKELLVSSGTTQSTEVGAKERTTYDAVP
jgi:hypothetical protein